MGMQNSGDQKKGGFDTHFFPACCSFSLVCWTKQKRGYSWSRKNRSLHYSWSMHALATLKTVTNVWKCFIKNACIQIPWMPEVSLAQFLVSVMSLLRPATISICHARRTSVIQGSIQKNCLLFYRSSTFLFNALNQLTKDEMPSPKVKRYGTSWNKF